MAAVDNQEELVAPETITLQANDGETFTVEKNLIKHSSLINKFGEDGWDSNTIIPLPNIDGAILEKILEWAEQHKNEPVMGEDETKEKRTDDIAQWDQDFFNVDQKVVFDLLEAANYLDMRALLETGCKTVANMIKGKTPREIRNHFNRANEFTKEEEEQIRRDNAWVED